MLVLQDHVFLSFWSPVQVIDQELSSAFLHAKHHGISFVEIGQSQAESHSIESVRHVSVPNRSGQSLNHVRRKPWSSPPKSASFALFSFGKSSSKSSPEPAAAAGGDDAAGGEDLGDVMDAGFEAGDEPKDEEQSEDMALKGLRQAAPGTVTALEWAVSWIPSAPSPGKLAKQFVAWVMKDVVTEECFKKSLSKILATPDCNEKDDPKCTRGRRTPISRMVLVGREKRRSCHEREFFRLCHFFLCVFLSPPTDTMDARDGRGVKIVENNFI